LLIVPLQRHNEFFRVNEVEHKHEVAEKDERIRIISKKRS